MQHNQQAPDWIAKAEESIPRFLERLRVPGEAGRFLPALRGVTQDAKTIGLGFSCFATKILHTLDRWESLDRTLRAAHLLRIKSYQQSDDAENDPILKHAFVDPHVVRVLAAPPPRPPWRRRLKQWLVGSKEAKADAASEPLSPVQRTVISETKQAIATLREVGDGPLKTYSGFPATTPALRDYLQRFDWTQPWGAGAHFAIVCVLLESQAPQLLPAQDVEQLRKACAAFIEEQLDCRTGGYFSGSEPEHGMLINGAMKVLTGLDWLGTPVHAPEKLIDTCLAQPPRPDGCHLVDALYVLHRCAGSTSHRRHDIQRYCADALETIRAHIVPEDGAFSYFVGRSQTHYYGVPITCGERAADIHGTVLLTWAVAMAMRLLEIESPKWRVIRP